MRYVPFILLAAGCTLSSRKADPRSALGLDSGGFTLDSFDSYVFDSWHTGDTARSIAGPGELRDGDLRITELHLEPTACSTGGTFVEVLNTRGRPVSLRGLTLDWGALRNLRVQATGSNDILEANEYAIIAREGTAACYGLTEVLTVSQGLVGTPRSLGVYSAGVHIDTVDFTGFAVRPGRSLALHPGATVVTRLHDREAYWCRQPDAMGTTTDFGSPGQRNADCPWTSEGTDPGDLQPGDLMITEVLLGSIDCASPNGTWLEIENTTADPIRIPDLIVRWRHGTLGTPAAALHGPPLLAPGRRALLGLTDIVGSCPYTFPVAWDIPTTGYAPEQNVELVGGRTVIDQLDLSQFSFQPGVALQLDRDVVLTDETSNDDPADWCETLRLLPGATSDRGSPGRRMDCDDLDTAVLDTGEVNPDTGPADTDPDPVDTDVVESDVPPPEQPPVVDSDPEDSSSTPVKEGCGCSSASSTPALLGLMLGCAALRRRRPHHPLREES